MRKALMLILVGMVLVGFKWGASSEKSKTQDASSKAKTQATETYTATSQADLQVDKKITPSNATVSNVQKTVAATESKTVNPPPVAGTKASGVKAASSLVKTIGTDNPDELKARIESLARVSRALGTLNEKKKAAQAPPQE